MKINSVNNISSIKFSAKKVNAKQVSSQMPTDVSLTPFMQNCIREVENVKTKMTGISCSNSYSIDEEAAEILYINHGLDNDLFSRVNIIFDSMLKTLMDIRKK